MLINVINVINYVNIRIMYNHVAITTVIIDLQI